MGASLVPLRSANGNFFIVRKLSNLYKYQQFCLFLFCGWYLLQKRSTGTVAFYLTVILSSQMDLLKRSRQSQ